MSFTGHAMLRWFILLDGSASDVTNVENRFRASGFTFERIDGQTAIAPAEFQGLEKPDDVINEGRNLLSSINTVLRLSLPSYVGLNLGGLIERRGDTTIHRTMLADAFKLTVTTVITGAGHSLRTREERLLSLLRKRIEIGDVASRMGERQHTWAAMSMIYESVAGLMSTKESARKKRSDFVGLVNRGWLSEVESERFYNTAAYHRHGYPKTKIRTDSPMDYSEAYALIKRLFWNLVDALEPK